MTLSPCMFVTPLVSQPHGWLKAEALRSIRYILVTLLESQPSRSSLNVVGAGGGVPHTELSAQNIVDMSVTCVTSHTRMCPYVDVASVSSENHRATAAALLLSVTTE